MSSRRCHRSRRASTKSATFWAASKAGWWPWASPYAHRPRAGMSDSWDGIPDRIAVHRGAVADPVFLARVDRGQGRLQEVPGEKPVVDTVHQRPQRRIAGRVVDQGETGQRPVRTLPLAVDVVEGLLVLLEDAQQRACARRTGDPRLQRPCFCRLRGHARQETGLVGQHRIIRAGQPLDQMLGRRASLRGDIGNLVHA